MADAALITDDLDRKVEAFLVDLDTTLEIVGTGTAQEFVSLARKHGIGLVDPDRHRSWIDETVHSGVLWRLARAKALLDRYQRWANPPMPSAETWTSLCNSPEPSR